MRTLIFILLLCLSSNALAWKEYIKYGAAGAAVYGISKLVSNLSQEESERVFRETYVYREDSALVAERLGVLEQNFLEVEGRVSNVENYVLELDKRISKNEKRIYSIEKDVKSLKEEKIGKKIMLENLSNGLIVKRSLFDARSKTRLGTKQYSQAAEQCHRSVTEQLKELIRSEDFNNYLSDYDISLLNIDIIDSTEALENVDPSLSLINHEKTEREVLVETRKGKVFDRRRDKEIREDSRLYKYKLIKYGYETYECYQRGPGGGGYGTCKSEEWIYDIEIFDIIGTPAHSSLNIQIPLILNENNEVECRSPLSVEHITEAISFYNKSKDGIALSGEDKHVMSNARHKLTKALEKGQTETRRSCSLKK